MPVTGRVRRDRTKRRLLLLWLGLALLGATAACGGGGEQLSKEEYAAKLDESRDTLVESFGALAASAQGGNPDISSAADLQEFLGGLSDDVEESVAALDSAADELADVEPPADAADAHDKLVQGIRLLADDFGKLVDALDAGELDEIQDISATLQEIETSEAGRLIQEAIDELRDKGYDLGGLGG
jgi:hypothetical protein